jgi:hypothetical protein
MRFDRGCLGRRILFAWLAVDFVEASPLPLPLALALLSISIPADCFVLSSISIPFRTLYLPSPFWSAGFVFVFVCVCVCIFAVVLVWFLSFQNGEIEGVRVSSLDADEDEIECAVLGGSNFCEWY